MRPSRTYRISTRRNTLDLVRFEWTPDGYTRTLAAGLNPADVHAALTSPGPHVRQSVDDTTLSVLVRGPDGTLIEVWLVEDPADDARELFAAFPAGFLGEARWRNAFGQEQP